jgi:Carboxypeptidase regulatory-like domain
MNAQQENILTMYYSVQELGNQTTHLWQTNLPFKTAFDLFIAKLPLIEQYRNIQSVNLTGIAQTKTSRRTELSELAFFVANRLQSYALAINDQELLAKINYPRSTFNGYRDTDLLGLCNTIYEQAQTHLAQLANYSLDASTLSDLQTAIQAYQAQIAKPRTSKSTAKTATSNLLDLFKTTSKLLRERLDRDIEVFKRTQPDFYKQYFIARQIVKTTKSKLALRIQVKEADSGIPLPNAIIQLGEGNESKKTTEQGRCQVKNLPVGTYQLSFEKKGYLSQNLQINIIEGETTEVSVEMGKG